ncbi:MAG: hypothetical protein ACRELB_13695 [Polyangiaceae bacterium]
MEREKPIAWSRDENAGAIVIGDPLYHIPRCCGAPHGKRRASSIC